MAYKSLFTFVACLVLCFMLMKNPSNNDCDTSGQHGCFFPKKSETESYMNRKVASGTKQTAKSSSSSSENGEINGWELRKVPSGPDPLHHNGNNPKKPRSP